MPYISQAGRDDLEPLVDELVAAVTGWGDINFAVTTLLHGVLHGASYEDYQAAIGVLECVKLELYRRVVSVYEELKIKENGDLT